jgi:hypothetical protein
VLHRHRRRRRRQHHRPLRDEARHQVQSHTPPYVPGYEG